MIVHDFRPMTLHSPDTYSGELSETRKKVWRLARLTRDNNPLYRLQAIHGMLVWGHPVWKLYGLAALGVTLAGLAWGLAGGRFDYDYWPLWLAASMAVTMLLTGFLFVERFTLDTLRRRWSYQRGWRWKLLQEEGGFDELSGFALYSARRGVWQPEPLFGATLEFVDGYRFFHAVLAKLSQEAARAEAGQLARACGLPLRDETRHELTVD